MKLRFNKILDIFYPRFCINCGKMGEFCCEKCYKQLCFLLNNDITQIVLQLNNGDEKQVFLDKLQAVFVYDEMVKKIIHQYKYNAVKDLSETLGFWLYQFLPLEKVDIITYIPVHRKRLDERGYNQAKLIAETLAQKLDKPCLPLLKRVIYKEKQALSLNKAERISNSENIFAIQKKVILKISKNSKVLIVDDVVTTGATINQAAKTLKQVGFEHVFGAALAHGN